MRRLPALDLHAHIEPDIAPNELVALDAAVFAVTRTLGEAEVALARTDATTVWGVGCHPGLVGAQRDFSSVRFAELIEQTAFVGEVGLDGKSRVPMATQVETMRAILEQLRETPRLASLHSYEATGRLLQLLTEVRPAGVVLHWWLGSAAETARAVDLGCYFSVNAAMLKHDDLLRSLPLDRVLVETDHPFGDRRAPSPRRPGSAADVEEPLSMIHGVSAQAMRIAVWRNLRTLVGEVGVGSMLPRELRRHLAAA